MNIRFSRKPITPAGWLLALCAALALSLFSHEADAQAVTEPAAMITAIYKEYQGQGEPKLAKGVYSGRLEKLMRADKRRTPKGEVGRLDFDVFINGQDWDIKDLKITETERRGNRAVVQATFVNFDQPQEIAFELVQQSKRWQIDEVTSRKKPRWTLSKILQGAADAFQAQ
jgi:hypothetical protein